MPKPTDYDKTHLRNMAAIGTRIDRIFKKAAEEAAKIGASIKSPLPEDKIFSFDDYPATQKQIERLMQALKESMEVTIVNGVESAWTLSNNKNNALVARIFGENATNLPEEQYRRYYSTNGAALDAFLQRKQQGLNLSDRVWKYTNAFKKEIELGLDLGIRSGESAAQMTRSLRQYLQYPDKLFRRVRDKHGNLRLSQNAKAFHPGQGVYRSSYKNARRLACTETNIAYRTSDYLRWQQMDFVVGIEIKLSNNHTLNGVHFTDICDKLKGRYPKDFKFVGWHPHCRCHAVSILKTDEEMEEDTQRILAGEKPKKGSVNAVQAPPAAFKDWVEEHSDKIEMGGNLPYFVKDNRKMVDKILGKEPEVKKTPTEIAKERHEARTPEEAMAIQRAWNERRIANLQQAVDNGLLPKEVMEGLSSLPQKQLNDRIAFLQKRASTHAARTPEEIQAIKDAWAEKQQRDKTTRLIADNVLKVAQDWQEVDFSTLQKLIADNNLTKMREEARKVAQAVKAMRDEEKALSDLIPDVHGWHKQFTLSELQTVHANVARTIKTKGWRFNIDNASDLATLRRGLEREVRWMETNGRKYKTWEVSRSAYQEKLKWAEKRIEMLDQKTAIESEMEILRKSRSKIGKQLVADFDLLFKSEATDLATLKAKAADIKAKAHQLEKTKAKKKGSESVSVPFAGMTDEEAKKAFADFAKKHGIYFDPDDLVADKGFIHLQDDQHREIYKALKMETEAEHDQLWNHTGGGGRHGGRGGYVQTGNSFEINKAFRQNSILGKLDSSVEDELRLAGMTPDDLKTIRLLDKKISECSLPFPMIATRYVQTPALEHIFGEKFAASLGNGERDESKINWMNAINKLAEKKIKVDPAFLSASTNEDQNVFTHYPVKLQIELPPNTPMYITNNYVESEIVLERGTRLEFISVEVKKGRDRWSDEYITIRCRIKR